ncbi:MAG: DUF2339 domain-containing protein, partial [Acidobacteriota bacterium]|nr:DUF2339 domain-containing protein [Acidobacteriota bacterium]
MDELILFFALTMALALPVAAIFLAVVLLQRTRALSDRADIISQSVATIRKKLEALDARTTAGAEAAVEIPPPAPAPESRPPVAATTVKERPAAIRPALDTPSGQAIERQFGTRIAVWLGALALALAGGFLVKYSVEQGWIGPTTRIVLGLVFGASLLGVGEWIARRYAALGQGLDAAGIAVLYSVLLAGVKLYGLYPPVVAFGGMLLTTAAAVVLSLRRGPLVAVLGLLGGFLTPILIGSTEPRPWFLVVYLVSLQSALLFVSRKMRWWPVAGLTLLGTMGWALLWMMNLVDIGGGTHHIGLLLLMAIVSFVVVGLRPGDETEQGGAASLLVWGGAGLGLLLLAALVGVGDFGLVEWTFLGIVGAGCIVLGRLDPRYEALAWIASICGAGLVSLWGIDLGPDFRPFFGRQDALWWVALALMVLFVGGSYIALWRSERPSRWAALVSVSGMAYFLAVYGALRKVDILFPWNLQALTLAAAFTALAVPVARRRETLFEGSTVLAALAVAVTALVSLA